MNNPEITIATWLPPAILLLVLHRHLRARGVGDPVLLWLSLGAFSFVAASVFATQVGLEIVAALWDKVPLPIYASQSLNESVWVSYLLSPISSLSFGFAGVRMLRAESSYGRLLRKIAEGIFLLGILVIPVLFMLGPPILANLTDAFVSVLAMLVLASGLVLSFARHQNWALAGLALIVCASVLLRQLVWIAGPVAEHRLVVFYSTLSNNGLGAIFLALPLVLAVKVWAPKEPTMDDGGLAEHAEDPRQASRSLGEAEDLASATKGQAEEMAASVFISYARQDSASALRIYSDLQEAGFKTWIDVKDLLPGERWRDKISQVINESDFFLALMSTHSVSKRGFVQKELLEGLSLLEELPPDAVFIIPVRLDECSPKHSSLKEINWVDLFPSYDDGFARILRSLKLRTPSYGISES